MAASKKNILFTNTNIIIGVVVLLVLLCSVLVVLNRKPQEGFYAEDAVIDSVNKDLSALSEEELKATVTAMRERLTKYGLLPEKMMPEIDRNLYVPKSQIPPAGPRIDMSQYVKKSSIPPEKVCPPQKDIDYTQYVKKSTLPPTQKCPPCIAPKVKVSAGLCKKCPDCPKCPPPTRCPTVTCPEPKPVEQKECPKCTEIKYIKVPTIITRTIIKDKNNNVIEEKETTSTQPVPATANQASATTRQASASSKQAPTTTNQVPTTTNQVPTTTKQVVSDDTMTIPEATRAANEESAKQCNAYGLNSMFKKFGIYGPTS
jgi:hypothetical protein